MFLLRNKKDISIFRMKKAPYLLLCQPVHPPGMVRVLVYLSLDSPETAEGTCDQLASDCTDAQADLSICWSHKSYCRFCHALAGMSKGTFFQLNVCYRHNQIHLHVYLF